MVGTRSLHTGSLLPTTQPLTPSVGLAQGAMSSLPVLNFETGAAQQDRRQSSGFPTVSSMPSETFEDKDEAPVPAARTTNLLHLIKAINKPPEKSKRKSKGSSDTSSRSSQSQGKSRRKRSRSKNHRSRKRGRSSSSSSTRRRGGKQSQPHDHRRSRSHSGPGSSKQDPKQQSAKADVEKSSLAFDLSASVANAAKLAAELRKKRVPPMPVPNASKSELTGYDHIAPMPPPSEENKTHKSLTLKAIQVRALLGKGGATINDIRRRSGSDIKIHHPPSEPEGTISIVGNADLAETIIAQHLAFKGCPMPPSKF